MVGSGIGRGSGRVARWVSSVGLVVAVAVVGAACGSGKSSERPRPVERWQVSLTGADGQALPKVTLKNGRQIPQLVVGGTYAVNATVPADLRSKVRGKVLVLQRRAGAEGAWKTMRVIGVDERNRIREKFTAGTALVSLHDYRIAVVEPESPEAKPAAAGASGDGGVRLMAATRPAQATVETVAASESTTAVGAVQYVVQLVNKTNNNLYVYVPTAQSDGNYKEAKIAIAEGATKSLVYTNPPPGTAMNFRVTKQSCLGGCTNYLTAWDWHPTLTTAPRTPGTPQNACSESMPQFFSNQVYTVELKDNSTGDAGFAVGVLYGPLGGEGTGETACSFMLKNKFANWMTAHPVLGFLVIVAAVAAVVAVAVLVAVAVEFLLAETAVVVGEAALAPAAESAIAEGAVSVVEAEVAVEAEATAEIAEYEGAVKSPYAANITDYSEVKKILEPKKPINIWPTVYDVFK